MRIVRYKDNQQKIFYGMLEDGIINPIEGDIFEKFKLVLPRVKKESVKLMAPVIPPDVIAIGLNYTKHANESGLVHPKKRSFF